MKNWAQCLSVTVKNLYLRYIIIEERLLLLVQHAKKKKASPWQCGICELNNKYP
jgi:hypothetical protein